MDDQKNTQRAMSKTDIWAGANFLHKKTFKNNVNKSF